GTGAGHGAGTRAGREAPASGMRVLAVSVDGPASVADRETRAGAVAGGAGRGRAAAARGGVVHVRPVESVADAAPGGRFERVAQGSAAQACPGARQALDDVERAGEVTVVQAFADAGEAVGVAVGPVDGLQAGQGRAGQLGEQGFPADLVGRVVERGEDTV